MKIRYADDSTGHILVSYVVTKDLLDSFNRAQEIQKQLFDVSGLYDRLVVSNNEWPCRGFLFIHANDLYERSYFNLSRARNRVLEYAQENGYDWVFLFDADSIIFDYLEVPESGFTQCLAYFSSSEEVQSKTFNTDNDLNWRGSGWFILPRAAFQFPFCEDFLSYYGEDLDYFHNVLVRSGIQPSKWCSRIIHMWHPRRHCTPEQTTRNKQLLARRLALLHGREFLDGIKDWCDPELLTMVNHYHSERNPYHAASHFLRRLSLAWRQTGRQKINR